MHIAIIADPIDKQSAGISTFTRQAFRSIIEYDEQNIYSIIRLKKGKAISKNREIILSNVLRFLKDDPLRTFLKMPFFLKKLNPDIVIEPAHFGPFNLPKRIKRVTIIHDLTPIKFPKWHHFHSQMLQRIFLPGILKRADLIITNSQNTRNDVIKYSHQAKNKTVKIYLGKEAFFKPTESSLILKKYIIEKPYFLFTGTIEPRKNLIRLLDAYQLFREKSGSEYQLIFIGGKGWKSDEFYKTLGKHKYKTDIKILGYVDRKNMPALYSGAYAFIYPSLYEGFGLPVLEAMACGTPCLISNVSSLPEVGGDASLYFDPNSSNEISDKMIEIANNKDLRENLSKISLEQAKKFSWEKYAKEFVSLLEEKFGT